MFNYSKYKRLSSTALVFLLLTTIFSSFRSNPQEVQAAVTGQIIVDSSHPRRMVYNGVTVNGHPKPVVLCGPGDPEDFFYKNTSTSLNTMINNKAKTTYITAYGKDFTGNPGTGTTLTNTLNEWTTWLDQLENAGVTIVFFFLDDGYSLSSVPGGWQTVFPTIVNKIKNKGDGTPRKLLIWSVAEEYNEALSVSDVSAVADLIKANDPNGHVIGVHQTPGTNFNLNSDPDVKMFLMQINQDDIVAMNTNVNNAWNNVNAKILNMAENIDHALDNRTVVRQRNWAAIMGGASIVQVHKMGGTGTGFNNDPAKYTDCNNLTNFMEATRVNFMSPSNTLKAGSTEFVLAEPGFSYVLYTRNGGSPGVTGMTSGTYTLTWLDAVTGTKVTETKSVGTGTQTFAKPGSIGNELALYLVKGGTAPSGSPTPPPTSTPTSSVNQAPVALNQTVSTGLGQSVFIQLQFDDPDGPGPYSYTITDQPDHGTLTGSDNDRTYTPNSGFSGTDTFKWRVNDGLANSNIATVTINVGGKPGDANGDGKVDGLDYVIWLNNYNKTVSGGASQGDFDGSGKVDGLDYVIWLTNYGK